MNSEERKEYNKQNVIEKAMECFAESGIERTTMAMIAKKAGVTTRSIQRYFHNKENLVMSTLKWFLSHSYHETKKKFYEEIEKETTGIEQVRICIKMLLEYLSTNVSDMTNIAEIEVYLVKRGIDTATIDQYIENAFFVYVMVQDAIKKGMEDGSIREDIDPVVVSDTIMGAYIGLLHRIDTYKKYTCDSNHADAQKQIATYEEIAVEYLKKRT